jgi:hypothetical protein
MVDCIDHRGCYTRNSDLANAFRANWIYLLVLFIHP